MTKVFPSIPRGHGKSSNPFYERPLLILTRTDMKGTHFIVYDGRIEKEDSVDANSRISIQVSPEDFDKYLAKAKLTGQYAKVYNPLKLAYEAKISEIFKNDLKRQYFSRNISIDESSDMVDAMSYAYLENRVMAAKPEEVTSFYASSRMTGPIVDWPRLPNGTFIPNSEVINISYDTGEDE